MFMSAYLFCFAFIILLIQHHNEDELHTSTARMKDQLHMTMLTPPPLSLTHLPLDSSDTAVFPVTGRLTRTAAIRVAGVT